MIRSGHIWYDLRKSLADPRLLLLLLGLAAFFVFFVSFQLVYVFALLFATMIAIRGLIGRRCPQCDGPLKETEAARDKDNAFVLHITWRCPRDGYTETETTKGDSGLFGAN